MAQWHQKHFSTQWGIAILGFFVIVIALLIPFLGQTQDLSSNASGPSQSGSRGACSSLGHKSVRGSTTSAKCQYTELSNRGEACNGGYVDGYCGGGQDYKCCVQSPSCKAAGGKCITVGGTQARAGGHYISGYCPGPSNVKCFIPPTQYNGGHPF